MYEYSKEEIQRIKDSIRVTTNDAGQISVNYQPPAIKEDHPSMSAILDCAYQQMHSFSLIETIYNALFRKTKLAPPTPCTAFADWMNEIDHAVGVK
ncbi:hypothetical protein [Desulfosporosinus shakirovi]|uniref:hypothetical protein n=1 Tax=Desulfosporosinus shakirovi TaxID=2885154 RepID=UPI001E4C3E5A|nr:hypothetical protein [Desulfosporosinus sp. SRJS8]MCB8814642.1 hypothetical protein [Desulfosporosinus sp. SRJS8]